MQDLEPGLHHDRAFVTLAAAALVVAGFFSITFSRKLESVECFDHLRDAAKVANEGVRV